METTIQPKGNVFWYLRTPADVDARRAQDIADDNTLDSAGEPRLYSHIGTDVFTKDTVVTIIRKRGITWPHWSNKPSRLTEGLATIDGNPRVILFRRG